MDNDVQVEPTSEGAVSDTKPFNDEQLAIIKEMTKTAALEGEKKGKSEMQSIKDAEIARLRRSAQSSDGTSQMLEQAITSYDPDSGMSLQQYAELTRLRHRDAERTNAEREQQQSMSYQSQMDELTSGHKEVAESVGIKEDDSRIEWARYGESPPEANKRVLKQIAKIAAEERKSKETSLEKKAREELNDQLKEAGVTVDSVNTRASDGGGGTRVFTRQQIKEMSMAEYAKNKPAIDLAESEGNIK